MAGPTARKGVAVETSVLDSLCVNYLRLEGLIETSDSTAEAQALAKSATLHDRCHAVRDLMEAGRVDEAISIADNIDPSIMKDLRLLYILKTRKFVELLRPRKDYALLAALACLRNEVAPLALIAYPEAYEEFKKTVLVLVEEEDSLVCAASSLWSTKASRSTATMLSRTIRQAAGAVYSKLALILRYLAFTHRMLEEQDPNAPQLKSDDTNIDVIISNLLGNERDPPPLPAEGVLQGFLEADIQALKEAAQLTRQEAIQALRHTEGDVNKAFVNEMTAFTLHACTVDLLVRDYSAERKFLELATPLHWDTDSDSYDEDMEVDIETLEPLPQTDVTGSSQGIGSSSPPSKVGRWRGREVLPGPANPGPNVLLPSSSTSHTRQASQGLMVPLPPGVRPWEPSPQLGRIGRVCGKIQAGNLEQAMERIERLVPSFLGENPDVAFMLITARFYQIAAGGNMQAAIAFSRANMTPLAHNNAVRTELLKTALASALTADPTDLPGCINWTSISAAVRESLEVSLGLQEPQLVQLLQVLLKSHKAWLRRQRCKDPFEGLLDLDVLRKAADVDPPFSRPPGQALPVARTLPPPAPGPRQEEEEEEEDVDINIVDTDSDAEGERRHFREEDVLLIMEFSGLGRPGAMDLLAEFHGDAEAALANIYG